MNNMWTLEQGYLLLVYIICTCISLLSGLLVILRLVVTTTRVYRENEEDIRKSWYSIEKSLE